MSPPATRRRSRPPAQALACALLIGVLAGGCAAVPVHEQRLVSKPNMQFSRSAIFSYSSNLKPQIEPGLATAAGSQASTCTLCR